MSKFKIGDTIHFMESNKPAAKEIKGIFKVEGNVEFSYRKYDIEQGQPKTFYQVGYSTDVDELDAFGTIEELQISVFNPPTVVGAKK